MSRSLRRSLFWVFILLLSLAYSASAAPKTLSPSEAAEQILVWVNQARAAKSLPPLAADPKLAAVAQEHSADMAQRSYFSHYAPAPALAAPMDRYIAAFGHYEDIMLGENIAFADQPVFSQLHESLLASPKHSANLLNPAFTKIGIGLYISADGKVWLTQMFTGPVTY